MSACVLPLAQLCPIPRDPMDYGAGFLCPRRFLGKNTGLGCNAPSRIFPYQGIEPMSPVCPALVGGFFTTEPPWKPLVTTDDQN